jgi:uncharacterized LabA/DUF88 family protein
MDCKIAVFIDFENIARGVRQRRLDERVDLQVVLSALEERGRILVKRAYADWGYFKDYRSDLLQYGVDPVQVFAASRDRDGWKNGADIRIAIDAIETAFRSPDVTDFVLVSGDSDFLSLVIRLREAGKMVWGMGLKSSCSQYLSKSCDKYLFYEDLAEWPEEDPAELTNGRRDSRSLLLSTLRRMTDRQGLPGMPPPGTPLKAAAVKAAMRRAEPYWEEQFEGFASFADFLQAHEDVVLAGRPPDAADYFVAERGTAAEANLQRLFTPAEIREPSVEGTRPVFQFRPPAGDFSNSVGEETGVQRYLGALRIRRIRHVSMPERYAIIRRLFQVFTDAWSDDEQISLKEAKDRLHQAFEAELPSVSWDSVNNVVYHLFWTYCFEFEEAEDEEQPLWDRPTRWNNGMTDPDEIIRRCDHGLTRMIAEVIGPVDHHLVLQVLGDNDMAREDHFAEICGQVNGRFTGARVTNGV